MAMGAVSQLHDACSTQFLHSDDLPKIKPQLGRSGDCMKASDAAADPQHAVDPLRLEVGSVLPGRRVKIKPDPDPSAAVKKEAFGDDYQEGEERTRSRSAHGETCARPTASDHQGRRPSGRAASARHVTGARRLLAGSASHSRDKQNRPSEASGEKLQERYRCQSCSQVFPCRSWLEKHLRTHTGEKPFSCEFCQKAFTQRSSLNKHIRHQHAGPPKPFKCNVCEKSFSTNCYLRVHEASHSGHHQAICAVCNRTFSHTKLLKIHLKCHSGRFQCDKCNKAFPSQSKLNKHSHRHSIGISLACSMCPEVLTSRTNLSRHVRKTHTTNPFGCDVCGRTFSSKHSLVVHVSSHTKAHQVSCEICGSVFSHPKFLNVHRKTHAEQARRSASRRAAPGA